MRLVAFMGVAALASCSAPDSEALPSTEDERTALSARNGSEGEPVQIGVEERQALAVRIERAVSQALPEIMVGEYTRYYTESSDGRIRALYFHQYRCSEAEATCAEAKTIWTSPDKIPKPVIDGGCVVVHAEYDLAHDKLIAAWCNGQA